MRLGPVLVLAAAVPTILQAAEPVPAADPVLVRVGPLTLRPFGFFDAIGMSRSSTAADSVSTKFGKIPLSDQPGGHAGESLGSMRHSRMMLKGELPAGSVKFSGYLESDFMNSTAGQSDYHWRQYWGAAQFGQWQILGGQAWSLLRPNRTGTASDVDTMNTDVTDPAYHVGLTGARLRQIRVTRALGIYQAAIAWEGDGNLLAKLVCDKGRRHFEVSGFTGRFGRRGAMGSAVYALSPRFRLVSQQYWSKRAAYQALGVVPDRANGASTLEGLEVQARRNLELYSYAGWVYGSRVDAGCNRLVGQWTGGINQRVRLSSLRGGVLFSLQYSHLERAVWNGKRGVMDFVMYRVRYVFN